MTAQIINFAQAKKQIEAKNMKAGQAVWEYGLRQAKRG